MNIIKKYTAIQLNTEKVNDVVKVKLLYGEIEGPYYNQIHPEEEFNTEEEAQIYAFKKDKWATWLILPIIRFDNFENN